MRIAILQPGYMPWLGFFEQMLKSDHFVYLDDVQYTKKDWRNRNRIKTANGITWLTVPTRKAPRDTPINRIEIDYDQPWSTRHLRTIELAYGKAPHFDECYPRLEATLETRHQYLHDLTGDVVDLFRDLLGIATPTSRSSELDIEAGDKNEKIAGICTALGADELYDGQAARSFLDVDGLQRIGIKVTFQEYVHPTYAQLWGPFVPFLSTLDLLMNCGADAAEIILANPTPHRPTVDDQLSFALARKGIPTRPLNKCGTGFQPVFSPARCRCHTDEKRSSTGGYGMKSPGEKIEFFRHDLGHEEKERIVAALDSLVLTTGQAVEEMESSLAAYLGVKHVVGLDSCTGALHLGLLASDIGPGDEVIVPAMTFIATANAVLMAGATPVFADVDPTTGCLTVETAACRITIRTKAIIPVHLYGLLCDIKALRTLADDHGLCLIEDSAHCLEAKRDGVRPASESHAACFSFYATKAITCGEGGALATNNSELADRVRRLSLHGMTSSAFERHAKAYSHWDMTELGWKYNLDNLRASLLLPQIARLDRNWASRRCLALRYEDLLKDIEGVDFPTVDCETWSARHLMTIWVDPEHRDGILGELQKRGIGVAVNYRPVHLMAYYRKRFGFRPGDLPNAEKIGAQTISLPLYPLLTEEEVDRVVRAVDGAVAEHRTGRAHALGTLNTIVGLETERVKVPG